MTRLSNRQHPMLRAFLDGGTGFHMSIEEAQSYDQRPFRSMLVREWIAYRPGRGFHLTQAGRDAWQEFHTTDISRKDPSRPLTAYFDVTAYGLRRTRPKVRTAGG